MVQGIGIDLVCISEFDKISSDPLSAFVGRHFTELEVSYAARSVGSKAAHLAVRYAAKEAVIKALESMHLFRPALMRAVDYREIEVGNDPNGRPYLVFYGQMAELMKRLALQSVVSLSHDGDYAVAQVVLGDC